MQLEQKVNTRHPSMPNPTHEMLADPLFNTIWQAVKTWDVNVPDYYSGYCGANGSHVCLIYNAIQDHLQAVQPVPVVTEDSMRAGWNACRKSIYAVCEDVQNEAERLRVATKPGTASEEQHAKGYYAGQHYAAKSIARGFNSMEAEDDDNFRAALTATASAEPVITDELRGQIAYQLTKRLVIDMPTARACVDDALKGFVHAAPLPAQGGKADE